MSVLVCLNATGFSEYARQDLGNSRSCIDLIAASLNSIAGISRIMIITGPDSAQFGDWILDRFQTQLSAGSVFARSLSDNQAATALKLIEQELKSDELVLLCSAQAPLLHAGLSSKLLASHRKWHAEYTFADGYPLGMSPEVISPEILPVLAKYAADRSISFIGHDAVFETVKVDINAFEIETDIAPLDLRLLRIDLHCDTRQNTQLCRNLLPIFEKHSSDVDALLRAIQGDQAPLRTLPSYFNVQISGGCNQVCSYCPWGKRGSALLSDYSFMPAATFLDLARKIRDFAPESVVSVSLWGEPARNPEIWDIIKGIRALAPLKLHVETSGLGWDAAALEAFAISGEADHVTWIVSLDSIDATAYKAMRGDGWQEALAAAHLFFRLFPKTAYIQAVRSKLNDEGLQKHYQYWKHLGAQQIIQKYDHFSGALPDLRLSDIAPLDRHACWHLKRDVTILQDGRVPLCREDIDATSIAGNALSDDLVSVWSTLEKAYRQHLTGVFPGICGTCDEYYTFNN